ncbi:MAG: AAA domain-containing protein [Hyphomicrobiaceae bacterium]
MLERTPYDWNASFGDLLRRFRQAGPIDNEDLIGAVRSLFEECHDLHEAGRVASLDRFDLLALSPNGELTLAKVDVCEPIVADDVAVIDVAELGAEEVCPPETPPTRPLYYPGYASWERKLGHHDALTDIFHLGMLMGSLATGLDFGEAGELALFVEHRNNLARLNPRLSPVLARIIVDMTRVRRAERPADLAALIDLIDDYRSVEVDDAESKARDLADVADPVLRRERTHEYFRNRLFEVTRRNKLLYFADRHGVDLTRGSLPVLLDYKALQPRALLTADDEMLQRLAGLNERGETKGELDLRRWLHCADYPFLAPSLDKMRSAARKDSRELGFNQLRLVLAFLRWHDDDATEPVNTPLVMLPVSLKKQPGDPDAFSLTLEAPVCEAEINPVLRFVLKDRFQVELAETLDMSSLDAIRALGGRLQAKASETRPGLSVRLVDAPPLPRLQAANRRQLDEHRRRQRRAAARLKDWRGIGYSYAADSYQPLGLELFDRFLRPRPATEHGVAGGAHPTIESGMPTEAELSAHVGDEHSTTAAGQTGPLVWDIDLCAVTLANFNTRKMSLVRDYEVLLDRYPGRHANYERLFEAQTRQQLRDIEKPPHVERNLVLPSDPSQDDAVLRATTGESYVIQGPPGTGKSQTIANLLADLAANGKSVLFVCEKRVALDVVYKRLRDAGIGDLASLVHDAREDRLPFIANLKALYESWPASRPSRTIRDKRADLVADIETSADQLRVFSSTMQRYVGSGETTLRDLLDVAIKRAMPRPRISLQEREAVPPWGAFVDGEGALIELDKALRDVPIERGRVLATLSALPRTLLARPDPGACLAMLLQAARAALAIFEAASASGVRTDEARRIGLETLFAETTLAARLEPLAAIGRLDLREHDTDAARRLHDQFATLDALERSLATTIAANPGWRHKPSAAETMAWLPLARRHEGRVWGFLSGEWRNLKHILDERLANSAGSRAAALARMAGEHEARAERDDYASLLRQSLGVDDLDTFRAQLTGIWQRRGEHGSPEAALLRTAPDDEDAVRSRILALAATQVRVQQARAAILALFPRFGDGSARTLADHLDVLDAIDDRAIELAAALRHLDEASPALGEALRAAPMQTDTLRAASLHLGVQRIFAEHPAAQRVASHDLQRIAEDLGAKLAELRTLNARRILDERKSRFRSRIGTPDETYDVGRAFLEHQFSLLRPSAALRDFLTGAPGNVVRDLKPIWMMSPLSVADTLPLDEALFDVVVFDEASQIPIEDALPTLYRAPQMIVVGDEMQLPPPSYFGRKLDTDDADLPDYVAFGMQAESLLDKAAAALPATRLEWHYRSRHESLIGFCNQAFYGGHLRTVPSRQPLSPTAAIDVTAPAPLRDLAQRVLSRPISFHRLPDASYVGQRNAKEAVYIADLVRALLSQDASKSIGIVAFSQSQQAEIEDALDRLATEHPPFRNRLDRALALDHEELFVKNLENVQGDERDIIIVSVAYGPGATGRMIMNFGPINQEGGEKRLNVIFSRAKQHVAVVASFEASQVTNDWNKGANALKRYLEYAAAVSVGDADAMQRALRGYPGADHIAHVADLADPLADLIAQTYGRQGRSVVRGLGQSTARCDVAVRAQGAAAFTTAVLTDNGRHYAVRDVIDRYVTYPGLLRSAGWNVEFALAKDWIAKIPRPDDAVGERARGPSSRSVDDGAVVKS